MLPFAPRWTGAVVPSYFRALGPVGMNLAVDVLYRDERFLDLDYRSLQPARIEINARITLSSLAETWDLTLAVRNITREVVWQQILDQPLAPGNFAAWRQDRGSFFSASLAMRF